MPTGGPEAGWGIPVRVFGLLFWRNFKSTYIFDIAERSITNELIKSKHNKTTSPPSYWRCSWSSPSLGVAVSQPKRTARQRAQAVRAADASSDQELFTLRAVTQTTFSEPS